MGDRRRFDLMADLVEARFPDRRGLAVADVAAGKGLLKAALYQRGWRHVTAWDKRRKLARPRPGQKFALFDWRSAPRGYRLVVAMHPDEATDHAILYACRERVPFVVCPCCIKPTAEPYRGRQDYGAWNRHLASLATGHGFKVEEVDLRMRGRAVVLVGKPA